MKKKLLIVALVIGLALLAAAPVFADPGPQNACHAEQLRGIFDPSQANPAVVAIWLVPLPDDFPPFSSGGIAKVLLVSGTTISLTYDEGSYPFPGFQCPQNPLDGDDTIVSISSTPPDQP